LARACSSARGSNFLDFVILSEAKDLLYLCDVTNVDVTLYFVKQVKSTTLNPTVPQVRGPTVPQVRGRSVAANLGQKLGQKNVPKTSTPFHPPSITFAGVQASRPILWLDP
jgi:hypothetical protein